MAAALGRPISAQTKLSGSVEAATGLAYTFGARFDMREVVDMRVGADVRLGRPSRPQLVVGLERDWLRINLLPYHVCNGSAPGLVCWQPFPSLDGYSLSLGAVVSPRKKYELRAGVGMGTYAPVYEPDDVRGYIAHADLTRFGDRGLGLSIGARVLAFPDYAAGRLTTVVASVGGRWRTPHSAP